MPAIDGDIAELDELQERIFDGLDAAFASRESFIFTHDRIGDDNIYQSMLFWFNPLGFRYWPDDRAAELLATWRYEIDHTGLVA